MKWEQFLLSVSYLSCIQGESGLGPVQMSPEHK